MFEIKKDIPIPKLQRGGRPQTKIYPFDIMEIGDCFDCPYGDKKPSTVGSSITSSMKSRKKTGNLDNDFGLITRHIAEDKLIRAWRYK